MFYVESTSLIFSLWFLEIKQEKKGKRNTYIQTGIAYTK